MAESLGNAGALSASTHHAGAARNLVGRKGRLPPGFDADILIVDGNPSPTSTPPHPPFHRGHTCHHQPAAHA
jgi:imidazolonepropionase-like amidohydrolase